MDLSEIRKEYRLKTLSESEVDSNPMLLFERWLNEANDANCLENNAMTLSTSSSEGQPSARIVLLKYITKESFYFFTNYTSKKGKDIAINNKAAALFFWPELERQVKIEGLIYKTEPEISDRYFHSRPIESQISAIISPQSKEVPNRKYLEDLWNSEEKMRTDKPLIRPDFWGGYRLRPNKIEFWQGREYRLHDRICYVKKNDAWIIKRLAP